MRRCGHRPTCVPLRLPAPTFVLAAAHLRKSSMQTTEHVQVHICIGKYRGREDWEMLKEMKRMRFSRGIQVKVLLTSNWIVSAGALVYQEDGFHRFPPGQATSSRPVCLTRYPCHPKGIKQRYARTKGSGKGGHQQMNTIIQSRFHGLVQAVVRAEGEMQRSGTRSVGHEVWEVVVELNCERRVAAEATRQAMQLIEIHRVSLARCVYYRPSRRARRCSVEGALLRLRTEPGQGMTRIYACRLQGCCTVVTSFLGHAGMRVCLFQRGESVCIRELLVLLHRRGIAGEACWTDIILFGRWVESYSHPGIPSVDSDSASLLPVLCRSSVGGAVVIRG